MRRVIFSSLVLVALVIMAGCTVNSDFTFTLQKTFTLTDPNVMTVSLTQLIDPTTNSNFSKYKSDITSITIQSAQYQVTRNTGPAGQTITASLLVADPNGANQMTLVAPTPTVTIASLMSAPTSLTIDPTATTQLQNWLKNSPNKAQMTVNATTNMKPTDFDVQVTLTVKANYSAGLLSFL